MPDTAPRPPGPQDPTASPGPAELVSRIMPDTALHCTALCCTALRCTAPHCTNPHASHPVLLEAIVSKVMPDTAPQPGTPAGQGASSTAELVSRLKPDTPAPRPRTNPGQGPHPGPKATECTEE